MADEGINKDCRIQNNSDYDLMVLNAFNNANTTDIIYETTLTPLLTTKGSKTIAKKSTRSVELNGYSKDSSTGEEIYNTVYELILVQPTTLFPIENVSEILSFSTNTYPGIRVSNDNFDQMNSAFKFYQTVEAFPTSDLVKNFNAAMQKASTGNITGIDTSMNAFFASTDGFKNVDMNAYATVSSYIEVYPLVWIAGKDNYTYYLYSPGQSSNDTKAAPIYQGKVTLKKITSDAILDPDDYNSGCTLTFTDPNNQNKQLYYDKGQFVDDKEVDIPTICLKGSFVFKSNLTYNSVDKEIIPFLSGTINNQQVMGSYAKQDGSSFDNSWYTFWHPQTFQEWIQLFLNLMGIIFALEFIYKSLITLKKLVTKLVNKVRNATKNDNAQPSETELNEISEQRNEIIETNREIVQEQLNQLTACESGDCQEVPEASEIEPDILNNRFKTQHNLAKERFRSFQNLLKLQEGALQKIAEFEVTSELEDTFENIETQKTNLNTVNDLLNSEDATNLTKANSMLDTINTGLFEINNSISEISENLAESLSENVKEQIIDAQATAEAVKSFQKEATEKMESIENGEIDPDVEVTEF